ncbi:MAG: DNA repair protein RecO [Mycoplasmoidaceae bacterium]
MAETILKGFIIDIKDYQIYDNILTIFAADQKIYNLLSLGSRKTLSKNGRNMKIGSEIEFEFFEARIPLKLSRLKKMHLVNELPWRIADHQVLNFLNDFLLKNNNNFLFSDYQKIIKLIEKNIAHDFIFLFSLFQMIKSTGIKFHLSSCVLCNDKNIMTTSISFYGYLCEECALKNSEYIYDKEVNEILYYLDQKQYQKLLKVEPYYQMIAIKLLKSYLNINY